MQFKYAESSFQFVCYRKHLLVDTRYDVLLMPDALILKQVLYSLSQGTQPPKYIIPLVLTSKISWTVTNGAITQFGFQYKHNIKYFTALSEDLAKLKSLLKGRLMFKDIADFYVPQNMLGKGGQSKVYLVVNKTTNESFASKCIDKRYLAEDGGFNGLFNEIKLMQAMHHERVISLEELYEGDNTFYLVLEYLQGSSLHEIMNKRSTTFDQDQIQLLMKQILEGVDYIHSMNIMHRDIKPENIMFKSQSLDSIRLVDFGLATFTNVDVYPYPKCGTPGYVAPEIANLKELNTRYTTACDLFSIGCIFHKLLTGKELFPGNDYHDILKLNKKCHINLDTLQIYRTPKEAIDLANQLLKVNPHHRITAAQALKHPYFQLKFESKKSKFQQHANKQNPVWQTQNFQTSTPTEQVSKPINFEEYDIVEDEKIEGLHVPVMFNKKTIGSFICKMPTTQQGKKGFRKFQTTEFDQKQSAQPSLIMDFEKQKQKVTLVEKIEEIDEDL